jgi:DNA polymerase III epsilon subunit-like protein
MDDVVINIHHITNEMAQKQPIFAAYAKELRDFIGDSQLVITCRTHNDVTLDIAVLNMEMEKAGQAEIPADQWLNVRRWAEEMFGDREARLDAVLDRYGISRAQRDAEGHGALLDAQMLAAVYPKLLADYTKFIEGQDAANKTPKINPPKL